MRIDATDTDGAPFGVDIDRFPDTCPCCHHKIDPRVNAAYLVPRGSTAEVHHVFQCPASNCCRPFIVIYRRRVAGDYYWWGAFPAVHVPEKFPEKIGTLSPKFVEIYNSSAHVETLGYKDIAGPGFRKALEFLVKDYLIRRELEKETEIRAAFLGNLIKEKISDQNLKACAQRAAWLGNDETHYTRIWETHDLNDLKRLIRLTVNWIESSMLTDEYIASMPDPKKGS